MIPRNNVEGLIEALQSDLPTGADEARIRAKLVGAGVLVSGVLTGASAAATTLGTATLGTATASGGTSAGTVATAAGQLGLWSKLVALPLAAKVGATTTLLAAVASVGISYTSVSHPTSASVSPSVASQGVRAVAVAVKLPANAPAAASLAPHSPEPMLLPVVEAPRKGPSSDTAAAGTQRSTIQAPPPAGAPRSALRATTLAQETPLIERAMLAIQAGDSARARYWLDEHARLFPQGLLARERSLAAARIPVEHP